MKKIKIGITEINIDDIESMEIAPNNNPVSFEGVRINFKMGGRVDFSQKDPEKYIEEYFTSQKTI